MILFYHLTLQDARILMAVSLKSGQRRRQAQQQLEAHAQHKVIFLVRSDLSLLRTQSTQHRHNEQPK